MSSGRSCIHAEIEVLICFAVGRELFKTCIPFHDTVVELDRVYTAVTGKSLIVDVCLFGDSDSLDTLGDIWPISVTLPALTILQISLIDTLAAIGIKPDIIVGHSAGETSAVYASGASSKAMAIELSIARGTSMQALEAHGGAMAALACSASLTEEIISTVMAELGAGILEIGCYNAPNAVTLSGSEAHVCAAVARAKSAGILATLLRTRIPVHSSFMRLCQAKYEEQVGNVFKRYHVGAAQVEVYSTLTGDILQGSFDARYFWDNTIGPVKFSQAIQSIHDHYTQAMFIELGPHPMLSGYIASVIGSSSTVISPLNCSRTATPAGDVVTFMDFVGWLTSAGYPSIDMNALYGSAQSDEMRIPPFPFARKKITFTAPTFEITRQRQVRNGPLNYPQLRVSAQTHSGLADHIIKNEPIMPASGFIEMVHTQH